ncbi:uncharacterized protein LOC134544820 [Bacillus rossius redtenbacheri]|uniref:uncharacterized protein LOC134544820 n=1 Tax=Bacillus rossius redtenbacheri TaxID=93214 RepID=UPI002FDE1F54
MYFPLTGWAQVQLVITSLVIMATNIASFQRFESQKPAGRTEPWKKTTPLVEAIEQPLIQPAVPATRHSDSHASSSRPSVPDVPAPPRPMSAPVPISRSSYRTMPLPSRKKLVKVMDEDEPLGKLISTVSWFFHLLCRMLSIASFAHFHPLPCLGVVIAHYATMLGYLLRKTRCPDITTVTRQMCLAYVYVFALIEHWTKFTKTPVFYSFYFILVGAENLAMGITWYMFDEWEGFWYNYVFIFIFVSLALSILSAFVYFNIFKPKSKLYDPNTLSRQISTMK